MDDTCNGSRTGGITPVWVGVVDTGGVTYVDNTGSVDGIVGDDDDDTVELVADGRDTGGGVVNDRLDIPNGIVDDGDLIATLLTRAPAVDTKLDVVEDTLALGDVDVATLDVDDDDDVVRADIVSVLDADIVGVVVTDVVSTLAVLVLSAAVAPLPRRSLRGGLFGDATST